VHSQSTRGHQVFLRGHSRPVSALALSASTRWLASGGCDGDVCLWDMSTASLVRRWEEHDGVVTALAFSSDERVLMSAGSGDGTLMVWDCATGGIIARAKASPAVVIAITAAGWWCDGTGRPTVLYSFATAGMRGYSQWALDAVAGTLVCEPANAHGTTRDYLCTAASPLPGSPWLYAGTASGEVVVLHTASRGVHITEPVSGGSVCSILAMPLTAPAAAVLGLGSGATGAIVVAGAGDGTVYFFHHAATSLDHDAALAAAAASAPTPASGGGAAAGAGRGGRGRPQLVAPVLGPVPAATFRQIRRTHPLGGTVWSMAPLRGGEAVGVLVSTSAGALHRIVATPTAESRRAAAAAGGGPRVLLPGLAEASRLETGDGVACAVLVQAHGAGVPPLPAAAAALAIVAGGSTPGSAISTAGHVASGPAAGVGASTLAARSGHIGATTSAAADAGALLTGLPPALVASARVPDLLAATFPINTDDFFVSAGSDGTVRLWDAADCVHIAACAPTGAGMPTCVAAAADFVLSGWQDGAVRAFYAGASRDGTLATGAHMWTIPDAHPAHTGGVTALALASNGRFLVTGGADGTVRMWDVRSKRMVANLKEHTSVVTQLVLLPGDTRLVSVGKDRSVMTWDLRTEKRLSVHSVRTGGLTAVVALPVRGGDGAPVLVTAGSDGQLVWWDVNVTSPLRSIPYPGGRGSEAVTLAVVPGLDVLAAGGTDGRMWLLGMGTGAPVAEVVVVSGGVVRDIAASSDGKQVVTVASDGAVSVWNVYRG